MVMIMNDQMSTAITSLNDHHDQLEVMIESFKSEKDQIYHDLKVVRRMCKQVTKLHTPNGLKKSIEDQRSMLEETMDIYRDQIKDCRKECSRIRRALKALRVT